MRERDVGIGHQEFAAVAAAARQVGVTVAGEVERMDGARPAGVFGRQHSRRALAKPVQQQQRMPVAILEPVQGEPQTMVAQVLGLGWAQGWARGLALG